MTDLIFENHFSLFLVRPVTEAGREWLSAAVSDDAQWFGGALVVEPRYVEDIALGADADGLSITAPGF